MSILVLLVAHISAQAINVFTSLGALALYQGDSATALGRPTYKTVWQGQYTENDSTGWCNTTKKRIAHMCKYIMYACDCVCVYIYIYLLIYLSIYLFILNYWFIYVYTGP